MEVWLFETEGEFLEFALMRMVFLETTLEYLMNYIVNVFHYVVAQCSLVELFAISLEFDLSLQLVIFHMF